MKSIIKKSKRFTVIDKVVLKPYERGAERIKEEKIHRWIALKSVGFEKKENGKSIHVYKSLTLCQQSQHGRLIFC